MPVSGWICKGKVSLCPFIQPQTCSCPSTLQGSSNYRVPMNWGGNWQILLLTVLPPWPHHPPLPPLPSWFTNRRKDKRLRAQHVRFLLAGSHCPHTFRWLTPSCYSAPCYLLQVTSCYPAPSVSENLANQFFWVTLFSCRHWSHQRSCWNLKGSWFLTCLLKWQRHKEFSCHLLC